ncbi:MAG: hypothetical protein ABI600_07300 [Luteolibacter sp.]
MRSSSFPISLSAIMLMHALVYFVNAAPELSRNWTPSATGKATAGILVSKSPDNAGIVVRLENGKELTVKTSVLIQEDQDYVKNWKAPEVTSKGIVRGRKGALTQAQGGQSRVMEDLKSILSPYGSPEEDTKPHPEALVYRGPAWFDGGREVSIPYLMPLEKALALLLNHPGLASRRPAVAPGFPPGMEALEYDIHHGVYNRMFVIVDVDKQVVALQIVAETKNDPAIPVVPPWKELGLPKQSTTDFIEPCTGRAIACVFDLRLTGKYIMIDLEKDAKFPNDPATRRETVLFLPEPMIRLCLFHIDQDLRPAR